MFLPLALDAGIGLTIYQPSHPTIYKCFELSWALGASLSAFEHSMVCTLCDLGHLRFLCFKIEM
jgi:hypothetical protein